MRSQCLNHSILFLTYTWITDGRECVSKMENLISPLTVFLMENTMPRGFMNELLSRTALKHEVFDKVNYIIYSIHLNNIV